MPLGNPIRKQNESRMVSVLATEGQTVFTVQGGYIINQISVFRNGVRLSNSEDFTAGDGSTVTLNNAANIEDRIEFHIFDRFTVQNAIIGAASTQTINGDLVLNGKLFGQLDVPSINLTGIITATELDLNGKGDISGDLNVAGVSTFTGAIDANGDLDVDGHTNLDNVSIAGVTTFSESVTISNAAPNLLFTESDANPDFGILLSAGQLKFQDTTNVANIFTLDDDKIQAVKNLDALAGIDVTGNLSVSGDVSIADKIVHTGDTNTAIRFPAADTITAETSGSERLRITSAGVVGINTVGARGATVEIQDIGSTGPTLLLAGGTDTEGDIVVPDGQDISLGHWNNSDTFTERLQITSNGNIGINTTPTNYSNYVTLALNDTTGSTIEGRVGGTLTGSFSVDSLVTINAVTSIPIVFKTANTERIRITSSGDLGLGIASPAAKFAIHETSTSSASSQLMRITTANGALFGIETDETVSNPTWKIGGVVNSGAAEPLAFYQLGSERLRITSSGQLLIGTDSNRTMNSHAPALQVQGANYSGATVSIISNENSGNGAYLFFAKQRSGAAGGSTIIQDDDIIGQIRFSGADGTDLENPMAYIECRVDGTPGSNDVPGRLQFYTTPDGSGSPAERLRITSSGTIRQSGGDLIIDNTNNGYGGLRIVDDSGGDYTVNYIAGRNQGATAHVFKRSGRVQNQSPWANSGGDVEMARIGRSGIAFGGDTAAANTLDDYEEGSWTPDLHFGGHTTGITYSNVQGIYTKIGRVVTLNWTIELSSKGSATGDARIYGYPYAPANLLSGTSVQANGISAYWNNFDPDLYYMAFFATTGYISIRSQDGNGLTDALDAMSNSDFGNSSTFRGSITYFAAT